MPSTWIKQGPEPAPGRPERPNAWRDRVAVQLALMCVIGISAAFALTKDTGFLMPGPLASAHGGIEKCATCHTKSGKTNLSWVHGLVAGNPLDDSKACMSCHKMPDTAFNPHSATLEELKASTERLTKVAAKISEPHSSRAQNLAFPTDIVVARDIYCATCHQEHQGAGFKLTRITNEQCRSCHVVRFDSFDGHHPDFESYPFKQRTRIIFDHAGHFGRHYAEVAKKEPTKRIPQTCSTCHNSNQDRRVMAVAPFDQTCSTCHLDQIIGKERASGPKGIAFLTVPGLDVQSLREKNAPIGEWPDASEATLSPFMKVMIGRSEEGRKLIKSVDRLNLQDLSKGSDDDIKAVSDLVWEVKTLFHALISGKASDVLGDLNIGSGAKLSPALVADLTASIPRDVVISAQQQWLPGLGPEMAHRQSIAKTPDGWSTLIGGSSGAGAGGSNTNSDSETAALSDTQTESSESSEEDAEDETSDDEQSEGAGPAESQKPTRPIVQETCLMRLLGQCILTKTPDGLTPPPRPSPAGPQESSGASSLVDRPPGAMQAGLSSIRPPATRQNGDNTITVANTTADASRPAPSAASQSQSQPQGKANPDDELLFPTEEELREMKSVVKDAERSPEPIGEAQAAGVTAVQPVISIDSEVDPESWAEYGGWYRQDFAIFYRPTGHKDKFIYSWLFLTGPQAPKGDRTPAASVFDSLTGKDAQGSCTKCHSIDDLAGKGRMVNFAPPSVKSKQGRFTNFVHEPHFAIKDDRGCLTCHQFEKMPAAPADPASATVTTPADATPEAVAATATADLSVGTAAAVPAGIAPEKSVSPYLKSFEQGDPHTFVSNFAPVKKDLCQSCHTVSQARQDCLLCHQYHLNDVISPIMSTKLPSD